MSDSETRVTELVIVVTCPASVVVISSTIVMLMKRELTEISVMVARSVIVLKDVCHLELAPSR
jgi:hypothetical protein